MLMIDIPRVRVDVHILAPTLALPHTAPLIAMVPPLMVIALLTVPAADALTLVLILLAVTVVLHIVLDLDHPVVILTAILRPRTGDDHHVITHAHDHHHNHDHHDAPLALTGAHREVAVETETEIEAAIEVANVVATATHAHAHLPRDNPSAVDDHHHGHASDRMGELLRRHHHTSHIQLRLSLLPPARHFQPSLLLQPSQRQLFRLLLLLFLLSPLQPFHLEQQLPQCRHQPAPLHLLHPRV